MGSIRRLMLLAFGLVLASLANYSFAQPIEIFVGRPPGGPIDSLARELARLLQQDSGGSVKVNNKPGANGSIVASYIRRFPGDHSKLLLSTQLVGAPSPDVDGLTPIIVVGTSAAWSQPLTLFAPPSLSQAQVSSLQRTARAAIMSAPFAATAARLSVAVSAEASSKGPNAAGIAANTGQAPIAQNRPNPTPAERPVSPPAPNNTTRPSDASYWGLTGDRAFLAYHRRRPQGGHAPDELPLGAYVTSPVLVTGPSTDAVLARLNQRYRSTGGQLVWVNRAEALRQEWNGPTDIAFGVLQKSCGAGFAATLIDGSTKSPANVGHAGMGFGRVVSLGCGDGSEAAMTDAIADCKRQGGCSLSYTGVVLLRIEVAMWDGRKVGALVGAGGTADVQAAYSGLGGCGFEISDRSSNVGPISSVGPITAATCRALSGSLR